MSEKIRLRKDISNKELQRYHGGCLLLTFTNESYELDEDSNISKSESHREKPATETEKIKNPPKINYKEQKKEKETAPERLKSPKYTENKSPEENLEERRKIFQNIIDTRIESYTCLL